MHSSRSGRVTPLDTIFGLIQKSAAGVSTAEFKKKTGLAERQIWNTVVRATKGANHGR